MHRTRPGVGTEEEVFDGGGGNVPAGDGESPSRERCGHWRRDSTATLLE